MGATPVEILDQLTDQPASFLFNMATPPFRSAAAKHIGTGFKWKSSLSPMIYHTDAGVVLYDRVVTGAQEAKMLQKLTKPKKGHAPNSCVSNVVLSGGAGAPRLTSPHHSPGSSPARQRPGDESPRPRSPHAPGPSSPSSAPAGEHRPGASTSGRTHHAAAAPSGPAGGLPSSPHRAAGSLGGGGGGGSGGLGVAGRAGVGPGSGQGARSGGRKQYTASLKSQADIEAEAANKYMRQQRATMTATQVFTWGGRMSHRSTQVGGARGGAGGARAAAAGLTPVAGLFSGDTHRAPLRLDPYHED